MLEKIIIANIIDGAQVITSTLVGAARNVLKDRIFDTVFIDEAAQALEPSTWIPITRARRVIFAGDHCQLPPTVKSRKAQKQGFANTLFEKCIARTGVGVMLTTQYRMHEHIMEFSNQQFYDGHLAAADSVKSWVLGQKDSDPILTTAVNFIDTAGCGYDEVVNPKTLSTYNPEEATIVIRHLESLLEQIQYNPAEIGPQTIGVVSPYRAQVRHLRKLIQENTAFEKYLPNMSIHTVDGFQGQERDIIYISLVRSNAEGTIGFLSDIRRMNVALTRARKKLVVVGDSATMASHPFYQSFLDYVDKINAYQSAWDFAY